MPARRRTTTVSPSSTDHRVRIRMYHHGLGDCMLLSFQKGGGKQCHMLIDCGVVLGTGEPNVVMTKVAQNVWDETKGEIDILVITHEHWDHLSGFDQNQAREVFEKLKMGELWLAWTESDDDLANRLRDEREKKKEAAKATKEAAQNRGLDNQVQRLAGLLGFFGAATAGEDEDDGGGTGGALKFLKEKRKPTIIETGKSYELPGVPDVRVYVLGPPKDEDAMKKTNPSKGEGYGLSEPPIGLAEAFMAAFNPDDERAQPFAKSLRLSLEDLKAQAAAAKENLEGVAGYYQPLAEWRGIDDAWLATGERLALQLDNATNNTSLVLAFELGGQDVLLFVGDAQAGNWRSWEPLTWEVKGKDGGTRRVTSTDLLNRTIFYKVGHHGSHNATLREKGLELMTSDRLAAFIPVDTEVAHNVKGWRHMPLPAIRERLEGKCAVIFQSDQKTMEKRKVPGTRWETAAETFEVRMKDKDTKKMKTVRNQPLYTDYFL